MALDAGSGLREMQLRASREDARPGDGFAFEGVVIVAKQLTTVRKTVKAIRSANDDAHEALIGVALGLAESVDALSDAGEAVPAAMWKELRSAAESLARVAAEVSDDGDSASDAAVSLPKVGD